MRRRSRLANTYGLSIQHQHMVICRFFAQGYCRKGNSCNFSHLIKDDVLLQHQNHQNHNQNTQEVPSLMNMQCGSREYAGTDKHLLLNPGVSSSFQPHFILPATTHQSWQATNAFNNSTVYDRDYFRNVLSSQANLHGNYFTTNSNK